MYFSSYKSREWGEVINFPPQQSGLQSLHLLTTIFFEFSPRKHLFSKMIQQTHWRHIHQEHAVCYVCELWGTHNSQAKKMNAATYFTGSIRRSKNNKPIAKYFFSQSCAIEGGKKKEKATIMSHNAQSCLRNHAVHLIFGLLPTVEKKKLKMKRCLLQGKTG